MKRLLALVVPAIVAATPSWAADVAGKWGIGAGVFADGGEVSLIRGHSSRTAWLLEVALSGSNEHDRTEYTYIGGPTLTTEGNRSSFAVAIGPGLRRYSRPDSEFSPYFDVSLRGHYQRYHQTGSTDITGPGASFGTSLGLEYFTRWSFSVAVHAPVASVSWTRAQRDYGPSVERNGILRADIGLHPGLFIRGYF